LFGVKQNFKLLKDITGYLCPILFNFVISQFCFCSFPKFSSKFWPFFELGEFQSHNTKAMAKGKKSPLCSFLVFEKAKSLKQPVSASLLSTRH
jgi:hypothetical protein